MKLFYCSVLWIVLLCTNCKTVKVEKEKIKQTDTTIVIKDVKIDKEFNTIPELKYNKEFELIEFNFDTTIIVDNNKIITLKQKYNFKKNKLNTKINIDIKDTNTNVKTYEKEIITKKEADKDNFFFKVGKYITIVFIVLILITIIYIFFIKKYIDISKIIK